MNDNDLLQSIVNDVAEIKSLLNRRLLVDRNAKFSIETMGQSLERRDAIDSFRAFAPFVKELLLAVDRLVSNEPSAALNQSIVDEIRGIMENHGIERVATDGKVDPQIHQIVGVEPDVDGWGSGVIVKVERDGYTLDGNVLRPARVVVTK
nr:nucleotide exchange factor GrpE [Bifidobacterium dentium]